METRTYGRDEGDHGDGGRGSYCGDARRLEAPYDREHDARARRTRRAGGIRRRVRLAHASAMALAASLTGAVLLLAASVAPAADPLKLEVNTIEDIVPQDQKAVDGTTVTAEQVAIAACLNETSVGTVNVGSTLTAVQNALDGTDADADLLSQCSLRMAIIAAFAVKPVDDDVNAANLQKPYSGPVSINIVKEEVPAGSTFRFGPTDIDADAQSNGGLSDAPPPLSPIVGTDVTIDGCATSAPSPTAMPPRGPCVNIDLSTPTGVDPDADGPSAVPDPPGLIAAAESTTIKGIAFQGGSGPAILTPPVTESGAAGFELPGRLTVQNSWFGLKVADKPNAPGKLGKPTDIGIQLSARGAQIGGPTKAERNVFAAGKVGVLIAGGVNSTISGNYFGTDETGVVSPSRARGDRLRAGVALTGLGANGSRIARTVNQAAGQALIDTNATFVPTTKNNLIEGSVFAGIEGFAIDVGGMPLATTPTGGSTSIGQVNASGDPVGVGSTSIQSNKIGVDANGGAGDAKGPAGNRFGGIVVRNGSRDTVVGGEPGKGNVISHSLGQGGAIGAGLAIEGGTDPALEPGAGLGTTFSFNTGQGNKGMLIDLGNDKAGNKADGPSGGIQAPAIASALSSAASGTAAPGSTVHVYLVPGSGHTSGRGDIAGHLATTAAGPGGNWSASISAPAGSKITATADSGQGTSELAANATVVAPPAPPPADDKPPLPAPPPADTTAPQLKKVLGKDPEAGPVVVKNPPKELAGTISDASGVADVKVALEIVKLDGGKGASAKPKKCRFVHLGNGKVLERPCGSPPFAKAEITPTADGASWDAPLSKQAQKRVRPGRYTLHILTTDTSGNSEVHEVAIRRKA